MEAHARHFQTRLPASDGYTWSSHPVLGPSTSLRNWDTLEDAPTSHGTQAVSRQQEAVGMGAAEHREEKPEGELAATFISYVSFIYPLYTYISLLMT